MEKLKVFSLFSGIGAFEKALTNLHIDHELIGFSEIDKYAIKSYCAIHNVDESLNYGDVSLIDKEKIPDFDLLVGGSPCQSFSVAGHRKGFEDTRGTLVFEYIDTLHKKQPKYFLYENVKGLINHDKGITLDVIAQGFSEVGYRIDIGLLNSKYFNVPQHRERLFIVGVREDLIHNEDWIIDNPKKDVLAKGKARLKELGVKTFNFIYPEQISVSKRLRDVLENDVDEKYYLSEEKTAKLVEQLSKKDDLKQIGYIDKNMQGNRVYDVNGIGVTIASQTGGLGGKGVTLFNDPFEIDIKFVGGIDTGNKWLEDGKNLSRNFKQGYRVYDSDGVATTLTSQSIGGLAGQTSLYKVKEGEVKSVKTYRIRKLTPLECFRLQAFTDEDFKKCQEFGISNSQLYKQAGNSITVSVLETIFKELFNDRLIHNIYNRENISYKKAE